MTLQYLIAMLSELSGTPLSEYNAQGELVKRYSQSVEEQEMPVELEALRVRFISECTDERLHVTLFEKLPVLFCGFRSTAAESFYIWGPIQYQEMHSAQKKRFDACCCYIDGTSPVSKVSIKKLATEIALVFSHILSREVATYEVIGWLSPQDNEKETATVTPEKSMEEKVAYRIRIEDEALMNHTYSDEQIIWSAVRRGDVEEIKRHIALPRYNYPLIIKNDPLKNEAYMAVVAISIISRVVIESGVPSSESFLMSDLYIKKVSECKTHEEIHQVISDLYIAFTKLVRKNLQRTSCNRYVEGCKNIVASQLFQKVCVADIAKQLNVRATYLARVFKANEGMTVTDYIHQEKAAVAGNMLIYSDKSISEIGEYLQFCNQSYFSKVFKKYMGETPKLYRQRNHSKRY